MTIETKEERLQKILQAQQLSAKKVVQSGDNDKDQDLDKGDKDIANGIVVHFKQIKNTPDEPDHEVKINQKIKYEISVTGTDLRLAEWKTSPKGILVLPNKKDIFVSIIDSDKTEVTLTGNRNGVASLNLILKDENDEQPQYSTNIQIRVTSTAPDLKFDCLATNCEKFEDLLTIRSESMQWPSKWEEVSKNFIVHLIDEEGNDVQNKVVELVFTRDKSTIITEPTIIKSEDDSEGKTRTNKYGIAIFKVKFKHAKPGEIAVFYASSENSETPAKEIKSKDFYVEITNEKLSSPKVPAALNGVLSYHSDNYCVNANLILGRDISESTQVGFYFNDQLKMLPCTDKSAISVRLENQALTNGVHYISFFTVDIFDNVCFSRRERIIVDNSLTGECGKKIKNIAPKPCISVTIPQICDRYFNSSNIRLVPTLCLQIRNRVAKMNIQKMIIIFNGYSKNIGSEKTLVYRSTMEIYADDPRLKNFLQDTTPNVEPINIVEFEDPELNSILADALPNIEVGYLGIQVMVFEKTGDCYLCGENMYTVALRLPCA
ncbi:hypothetical protein [Proteus hauseri]|uniref:hypothetical protein n=1 Tax=Proteus hauseri TaxID=183417 RepID=UPI0010095DEB|nr:hypothetical protein [Proteus hauseri]QAV21876.1 hypothetical protein PH4a_00285 [Proteus hauseri]